MLNVYIQNYSNISVYITQVLAINDLEQLLEISKKGGFEIKIKSQILQKFFENWSDFEKSFFECLVKTHEKKGEIQKLNSEFSLIRKHLKDYIQRIQIDIENSDIEYLDFFKSVLYSNKTDKRELIDFLGIDSFEVYSFGHSFEISDFTILREIFLHINCKKIKVYYHPELKSEDYNKKRKLLRLMLRDSVSDFSKLVERSKSESMPVLKTNL